MQKLDRYGGYDKDDGYYVNGKRYQCEADYTYTKFGYMWMRCQYCYHYVKLDFKKYKSVFWGMSHLKCYCCRNPIVPPDEDYADNRRLLKEKQIPELIKRNKKLSEDELFKEYYENAKKFFGEKQKQKSKFKALVDDKDFDEEEDIEELEDEYIDDF